MPHCPFHGIEMKRTITTIENRQTGEGIGGTRQIMVEEYVCLLCKTKVRAYFEVIHT